MAKREGVYKGDKARLDRARVKEQSKTWGPQPLGGELGMVRRVDFSAAEEPSRTASPSREGRSPRGRRSLGWRTGSDSYQPLNNVRRARGQLGNAFRSANCSLVPEARPQLAGGKRNDRSTIARAVVAGDSRMG
jgi:hypothetical protein